MYHHLVDVNSSAIRLSAFFNGIFPTIVLNVIIIIIYTNSKAMSLYALSTVNFPVQSILDVWLYKSCFVCLEFVLYLMRKRKFWNSWRLVGNLWEWKMCLRDRIELGHQATWTWMVVHERMHNVFFVLIFITNNINIINIIIITRPLGWPCMRECIYLYLYIYILQYAILPFDIISFPIWKCNAIK